MPQSQYRHRSSGRPSYGRARFSGASHSSSNSNRGRRGPKKAYIDPSRFVQAAQPVSDIPYVPTHTFNDFNMHQLIRDSLGAMGFTDPSPIQDEAIPAGLAGRDIVGIANTGTGKTAAFAVPLLNRLMVEAHSRAIVLAPTRELAQQIEEQFRRIAKGSNLGGVLLIGGTSMGPQLRALRSNPQIIIGTPGRVKDHLERGSLRLDDCNMTVLDEVDRMLDMGFIDDIRYILGRTSADRQSFYFSATLDQRVRGIIETFSSDPIYISVKSGETSANVEQNVIPFTSTGEKIGKLHDLLIQGEVTKTLVFDDTHHSVEKLAKELALRGFSSDSIHGGKSQGQRQRVFKKFKDGQIDVLVATDVAARGLDVSDISHVINYSTPQSYEDYVHRIGRTGRAGKTGHALTFIAR